MSKTEEIGTKTQQRAMGAEHSRLSVRNKDPNMDYSFRARKEIEEGGGQDSWGFVPVGSLNSKNEEWDMPDGFEKVQGTKGKKQLLLGDTVLCKRPKKVAEYFKRQEDMKYNAQINLVKTASKRAEVKLRNIDGAKVRDDGSKFEGQGFTDRVIPSDQGDG